MIEIRELGEGDKDGLAGLMDQFFGQSDQALDDKAVGRLFERAAASSNCALRSDICSSVVAFYLGGRSNRLRSPGGKPPARGESS